MQQNPRPAPVLKGPATPLKQSCYNQKRPSDNEKELSDSSFLMNDNCRKPLCNKNRSQESTSLTFDKNDQNDEFDCTDEDHKDRLADLN